MAIRTDTGERSEPSGDAPGRAGAGSRPGGAGRAGGARRRRGAEVVGWSLTLVLTAAVAILVGGFAKPAATRHQLLSAARAASNRTVVSTTRGRPVEVIPDSAVTTRAASLQIYRTAGGAPLFTEPNPTIKGAPLWLLVVGSKPGWDEVLLPIRPNMSVGWVPDASVRLVPMHYRIDVVQHLHVLRVYRDGALFQTFPVAVGKPSTPTPDGLFFVDVLISTGDPTGPYGPNIVGLSGFSDTYTTFEGGDAIIGIHGTDQPWVIGTSATHGCVRVHDDVAAYLASFIPLGTPVRILS